MVEGQAEFFLAKVQTKSSWTRGRVESSLVEGRDDSAESKVEMNWFVPEDKLT